MYSTNICFKSELVSQATLNVTLNQKGAHFDFFIVLLCTIHQCTLFQRNIFSATCHTVSPFHSL